MKVGDHSSGIIFFAELTYDRYKSMLFIDFNLLVKRSTAIASYVKCTLISQPLSSLCYVGNIGSADDEELFISYVIHLGQL